MAPTPKIYDRAADWSSPRRTRLELTMLDIMNNLTDKHDWTTKVRDEAIRTKWQAEMQVPLAEVVQVSTETLIHKWAYDEDFELVRKVVRDLGPDFVSEEENKKVVDLTTEFILDELLVKADAFDAEQFTTVLGQGGADIAKSDTIVSEELKMKLRGMCEKVDVSWGQPGQPQVKHLVHPSLQALEYGKTFLLNGDCVEAPGKEGYSDRFQWLPAEFNGALSIEGFDCGVLTELVKCALPMWSRCIATWEHTRNRVECFHEEHTMEPTTLPMPSEWVDRYGDEYKPGEPWEVHDPADDWAEHAKVNVCPPPVFEACQKPDIELGNLQVIVKISGIELAPGERYEGGSWHVEGLANEHICATAVYYYDSCNVRESSISFRAQAEMENYNFAYGQDRFLGLERVYDTRCQGGQALQRMPSVVTREGRLLTFPNVFQHCVSPFELEDPSKPGHRRIIVLWLVNPQERIVSTTDVLPREMSREERIAMQEEIIKERSVTGEKYGEITATYNFCEH